MRRDDANDMDMILTPTDHLSPPSTTSRLSDSDTTSECDIDGVATGRDGASISSLGSSSSPPAEVKILLKKQTKHKHFQIRKIERNKWQPKRYLQIRKCLHKIYLRTQKINQIMITIQIMIIIIIWNRLCYRY